MNFDELKAGISDRFTCVDGPKLAYWEYPYEDASGTQVWVRHLYQTVSLRAQGGSPEVNSALCKAVLATLDHLKQVHRDRWDRRWALEDYRPILYWRRQPQLDHYPDPQTEVMDAEGNVTMLKRTPFTEIRLRFTIPGLHEADYPSTREGCVPQYIDVPNHHEVQS